VSVVVPVCNGAATLFDALTAIGAQLRDRPAEIIVVDDGSEDGSRTIAEALADTLPLVVIQGPCRGAAAAINRGIAEARFPLIAQIDQDVVIREGWLSELLDALAPSDVAAAQGHYIAAPCADWYARVMGLDLAQRYRGLRDGCLDHVCTGNTLYRRSAVHQVGLFDESLGYGYDNDLSYRLRHAGYRLALCRTARSVHYWRQGLSGYLMQQYGFGYGRLDLVAKHPRRLSGDRVSPAGMMAHPLIMTVAVLLGVAAAAVTLSGGNPAALVTGAAALLGGLAVERLAAGARAVRQSGDRAGWLFMPLHLLRDLAWMWAIGVWLFRRIRGVPVRPRHSMQPRLAAVSAAGAAAQATRAPSPLRSIALIPAHNEAGSLRSVIEDLRARHPEIEVLVIDDGSTDGTGALLPHFGVAWLQFPQRMGIGSAIRAGVRYARRRGYSTAIRIDGDGQHGAGDVSRLLAPIVAGHADVVLGSRFAQSERRHRPAESESPAPSPLQRALGLCLSGLTGARVSDPTSGFYALGPEAMRVLADHHPTGYPEPELRLLLSRTHLRVCEVAVQAWPRRAGRTSLTPLRLCAAGWRVLLAMIIVPLRGRVGERV
jgi:glycosyltransferase involved in cell wall biosynthesis